MEAKDALSILAASTALENQRVHGCLALQALSHDELHVSLHNRIHLRNCTLDSIDGADLQFHQHVSLEDCHILARSRAFFASYFLAGFSAVRCRFDSDFDFQCGGHNRAGASFALEDCVFAGFVNFFDCQYDGPVIIRRCVFQAGSNLLGNVGRPFQVSFDVTPVIEENEGNLVMDGG